MVSNMPYTKFTPFHGFILCMQGAQNETSDNLFSSKFGFENFE